MIRPRRLRPDYPRPGYLIRVHRELRADEAAEIVRRWKEQMGDRPLIVSGGGIKVRRLR